MTAHILVTIPSLHFRSNQEIFSWFVFTFLKLTGLESGLHLRGGSCTAFVYILPPWDWRWWGTKLIPARALSEGFPAWSQFWLTLRKPVFHCPWPLNPLVISCWLQPHKPLNKLVSVWKPKLCFCALPCFLLAQRKTQLIIEKDIYERCKCWHLGS